MFVLRCWIIRRFPTRLSGPKRLLVHIDSTPLGRRIADRDDVYRAIAPIDDLLRMHRGKRKGFARVPRIRAGRGKSLFKAKG